METTNEATLALESVIRTYDSDKFIGLLAIKMGFLLMSTTYGNFDNYCSRFQNALVVCGFVD